MGSQRCARNLIGRIGNTYLQNGVGDILSQTKDMLLHLQEKFEIGIDTNYETEWHRFPPSCPQPYTRFIRVHLETHDLCFACMSWHTIWAYSKI